jgi:hypothetical protein
MKKNKEWNKLECKTKSDLIDTLGFSVFEARVCEDIQQHWTPSSQLVL